MVKLAIISDLHSDVRGSYPRSSTTQKQNTMILRTFDEPTDVIICGIDFTHKPETFSLTDDYSMVAVANKDKIKFLDTCGFVYVLTREEANDIKDALDEDDGQEWILLKDYVGSIGIHFEDDDRNRFEIPQDTDLREYLSDIFPGEGWFETVIDIECEIPERNRGYESLLEELG